MDKIGGDPFAMAGQQPFHDDHKPCTKTMAIQCPFCDDNDSLGHFRDDNPSTMIKVV